ncbi:hypothetical protein HK104_005520, partial [Borealophlyctis nickersoniae]
MHITTISVLAALAVVTGAGAAPSGFTSLAPRAGPTIPPLPANYETLSAAEKKQLIWDRIQLTANTSQPHIGTVETGLLLVTLPARPPFDRVNDEMVPGRKKFIRNNGAVAQVKIVPSGKPHPFTGIWATGAEHGIMRLTTLGEPPKAPKETDVTLAPGGTIKIFRDGRPSTNLFAIYNLEGQKNNWNYFTNPLSNHLAPPAETATKFAKT